MADHLAAADGGGIEVGAVAQRPLDAPFAMQDVEHRLHRGGGQVALQMLLHGLDVGRPCLPQHAHDLKFERREVLDFASCHQQTPKLLGGYTKLQLGLSTKILGVSVGKAETWEW